MQAFLFFHKILHLNAFDGADFKHDNSIFKFRPKNTQIPYQPKKGRPKFSSAQIFIMPGKFRHFGPTNNLRRQKFGLFLKFHIGVKFLFKYISSFRLVNSHYIL